MKKVLITGASGGIGSAIAKEFGENGYHLILHYNKTPIDLSLYNGFSCETVCGDLSNEQTVSEIFSAHKNIDVLVNNAGISLIKFFDSCTIEDFESIFNANVKSAFLCCKYAVRDMLKNKNGNIINISSIWGQTGASMEVLYSASKAALIGMTQALAKEVAPSKIRVNCIAPGVIDTKMNAFLSDYDKDSLCEEIPMGKIGSGEDVGKTAVFLAENNYITGQVFSVNGGMYI